MRHLLTAVFVAFSACTASTPQWMACEALDYDEYPPECEGRPEWCPELDTCPDGYFCALMSDERDTRRELVSRAGYCSLSCAGPFGPEVTNTDEYCEAIEGDGTAHAECARHVCKVRCGSALTCPDGTSCNGGYCTP